MKVVCEYKNLLDQVPEPALNWICRLVRTLCGQASRLATKNIHTARRVARLKRQRSVAQIIAICAVSLIGWPARQTRESPVEASAVKTLDLNRAAAFLHMHPEEVRTRAKRGLIPGAKAGRCWIFLDVDLAEFVRSLYPVKRQALRVTNISQEDVCHYANAGRSGGSTSWRLTASEYAHLLKPATKPERKSCTIS